MKPEGSLQHSQVLANCAHPEPARTKLSVQVRDFLVGLILGAKTSVFPTKLNFSL